MEIKKKMLEFWDINNLSQDNEPTVEESATAVTEEPPSEKRPQDDIPTEVIIHYIVKDYQRMFNKCEHYEPRIRKQREKIRELTHLLRRRQVGEMSDQKTKQVMEGLYKQIDNDKENIAAISKERDELKERCEKLSAQIEEVRNSRNAVVESVTEDLQEKLEEANQRIRLLAQAVVDPQKSDNVFLQQFIVHTIETDDDKKWMAGATKQLEKAAMKLLSIEERLVKVEERIKDSDTAIEENGTRKNIGKVISRINATVSHVECFMDKVGNIEIN